MPRSIPIARVEINDLLDGDPVVQDRGNQFWVPISKAIKLGRFLDYSDNYLPKLAYNKLFGLICNPRVVFTDTTLNDWETESNTATVWEERRHVDGFIRKTRLFFGDTSVGTQYAATSIHDMPEHINVNISIILSGVPDSWEDSGLAPFLQVDFGVDIDGNGQWAIRLDRGGTYLLYNYQGQWQKASEIASHRIETETDLDEKSFTILNNRDGISISTNLGQDWTNYAFPDRSPTIIRSGKVRIFGQGHKVAFGFNQVIMETGRWRSPQYNTFITRIFPWIVNHYPYGYIPEGGAPADITIQDQSPQASAYMQFDVILEPTFEPHPLFTFYRSPEFYANLSWVSPTASIVTQAFTEPFVNKLDTIQVKKDPVLENSQITVNLNSTTSLDVTQFNKRKFRISLGTKLDGVVTYPFVFYGYVSKLTQKFDENSDRSDIAITVENVLWKFKTAAWLPTDVRPLSDMTINQALDFILQSEGVPLNLSYRVWHLWGEQFLSIGNDLEKPNELIKPGELKIETMRRLLSYVELELTCEDAGYIAAVPVNSVSPILNRTMSMIETGGILNAIKRITTETNYSETPSCIVLTEKQEDIDGKGGLPAQTLLVYAVDGAAEHTILTPRTTPWRTSIVEDFTRIEGQPWAIFRRVQFLALKNFRLRRMPNIVLAADVTIQRGMRVAINGAGRIDIPDGTEFKVVSIDHTYTKRVSTLGLETTVVLEPIL